MNVEFREATKEKTEVISVFEVVVGGACLGEVKEKVYSTGGNFFHALLMGIPGGLAQGFGDTPAEAVSDALLRNIEESLARVDALERLQALLAQDDIQPTGTEV